MLNKNILKIVSNFVSTINKIKIAVRTLNFLYDYDIFSL